MKHLEKFNFFFNKKREKEEKLYQKKTYDEATKFLFSRDRVDFNTDDINRLQSIVGQVRRNKIGNVYSKSIYFRYSNIYYHVYKVDDDWFICHSISSKDSVRPKGINKYYICDGIDGLAQMIKTEKII